MAKETRLNRRQFMQGGLAGFGYLFPGMGVGVELARLMAARAAGRDYVPGPAAVGVAAKLGMAASGESPDECKAPDAVTQTIAPTLGPADSVIDLVPEADPTGVGPVLESLDGVEEAVKELDEYLDRATQVFGREADSVAISRIPGVGGDSRIEQLFAGQDALGVLGSPDTSGVYDIHLKPKHYDDLAKAFPMALGTVALPMSPEGGPLRPVVLGLVATGAVLSMFTQALGRDGVDLKLFQNNKHAEDRRGKDLATYIATVVEAAFMNPDPNNNIKKTILCGLAGIVEGCDQVVNLIVEVASRSNPGKLRTAVLAFGRRVGSGEWVPVTAIYSDRDLAKQIDVNATRGLTAANCGRNTPPPGMLLAR